MGKPYFADYKIRDLRFHKPSDNPFYNTAAGKYRAIYALGFRNPYTGAIDPDTGRVFVNDVGFNDYEEINELEAGKNYGWPITEGPIRPAEDRPENYKDPIFSYFHAEGYCPITGGIFYRSTTVSIS